MGVLPARRGEQSREESPEPRGRAREGRRLGGAGLGSAALATGGGGFQRDGAGEDGVVRASALGRLVLSEAGAGRGRKTFLTEEGAGRGRGRGCGRGWVGEWESGRGQRVGARGGAKVQSLGGWAGPRNWAGAQGRGGAASVSAPRTAAGPRVLSLSCSQSFPVWGERNLFSVSRGGRVPLGLRRWAQQLHTVEVLGRKGHERRGAARGSPVRPSEAGKRGWKAWWAVGEDPQCGHSGLEAKGVQCKWHSSWQ